MAVAHLISGLSSLPQFRTPLHRPAQVTIIHAKIGEEAFGTSPGEGSVMATLRSHSEEVMDVLVKEATSLSKGIAEVYELRIDVNCMQVFPPTVNHPEAAKSVERAARELGMGIRKITIPFGWSEDFGHFTSKCKGALFGLGAGENHPVIHHPEYDFPERLLEPGINLFGGIIRNLLG
jgi:metal-dependent amidase/aminoacylase/carboxypeptidase family protein